MSLGHGSSIVRDGLVFYVDFANIKSYPGSGTVIAGLVNNLNSTYINNNGVLLYDTVTKSMQRAIHNSGHDLFRSDSNVLLGNNFTFQILAKVWDAYDIANGMITNHSHADNAGAGITIKRISGTDYRVSCNTGSGTDRTYSTYYGVTNIYNKWSLLTLRFIGSNFTLWVNDVMDYSGSWAQYNISQPIDLFNWSTTYSSNYNYRPGSAISTASVYNIALSDIEIKQNFNALRGRYSI